jgi:OmpA-OmpF porin, OOP family
MKKMLVLSVMVIASTGVSQQLLAQVRGPFVGASIGQSTVRADCAAGNTCERSDTAFSAFVGHQIDKFAAIEAGYTDLGKFTSTGPGSSARAAVKGFEVSGIGSMPFGARFSLIGRVGVYRWNLDQDSSGPGGSLSQSKSGTDLTFGFGMRFNFTNNFSMRVQYQRYRDVGDASTNTNDIDVISAGALFSF